MDVAFFGDTYSPVFPRSLVGHIVVVHQLVKPSHGLVPRITRCVLATAPITVLFSS